MAPVHFHDLYLFATFSGPRSLCPLSFSYHRPSRSLNFYQSGYKYAARSLALRRASLLSTAICPATGALPVLYISDVHLSLPPLSVRLQVRCSLSASPTRISPFQCSLSGYRCVARSPPLRRASPLSTASCRATGSLLAPCLSDVHISFPVLSLRLQVHCPLSTSMTRLSPSHR